MRHQKEVIPSDCHSPPPDQRLHLDRYTISVLRVRGSPHIKCREHFILIIFLRNFKNHKLFDGLSGFFGDLFRWALCWRGCFCLLFEGDRFRVVRIAVGVAQNWVLGEDFDLKGEPGEQECCEEKCGSNCEKCGKKFIHVVLLIKLG